MVVVALCRSHLSCLDGGQQAPQPVQKTKTESNVLAKEEGSRPFASLWGYFFRIISMNIIVSWSSCLWAGIRIATRKKKKCSSFLVRITIIYNNNFAFCTIQLWIFCICIEMRRAYKNLQLFYLYANSTYSTFNNLRVQKDTLFLDKLFSRGESWCLEK